MSDRAKLILLPGMHGTAELFKPFTDVLPADAPYRVLPFPTDVCLTYDELLALVEKELESERQMVIVAESFAGPIGIKLAAKNPDRVKGLVLSASFAYRPWSGWLRWLIGAFWFKLPMPDFLVRLVVSGWDSNDEFVDWIRNVLRSVSPQVLACRCREVLRTDCRDELAEIRAPILYLKPTDDFLVRQRSMRTIFDIQPNTRVENIPGPHVILQYAPQEAWDAIQTLLR